MMRVLFKRVLVAAAVVGLALMTGINAMAAEVYKGDEPPPLSLIEMTVKKYGMSKNLTLIGLHKTGEGAYTVISNKSSNEWGGPFSMLRLETKEWVVSVPPFVDYKKIYVGNIDEVGGGVSPPTSQQIPGAISTQTTDGGGNMSCRGTANIYSKPDTGDGKLFGKSYFVKSLPAGTPVSVIEKRKSGWVYFVKIVMPSGEEGWIIDDCIPESVLKRTPVGK